MAYKIKSVLYMMELEAVSQQWYVSWNGEWGSKPPVNAISVEAVADQHGIL